MLRPPSIRKINTTQSFNSRIEQEMRSNIRSIENLTNPSILLIPKSSSSSETPFPRKSSKTHYLADYRTPTLQALPSSSSDTTKNLFPMPADVLEPQLITRNSSLSMNLPPPFELKRSVSGDPMYLRHPNVEVRRGCWISLSNDMQALWSWIKGGNYWNCEVCGTVALLLGLVLILLITHIALKHDPNAL